MFIDNDTRLRHILDAAREAVLFAQDKTRSDLNTNRMLTLSLVNVLKLLVKLLLILQENVKTNSRKFPGRKSSV